LVQVGFACYSVSVHCLFELKEFDLGCEVVLVKTRKKSNFDPSTIEFVQL